MSITAENKKIPNINSSTCVPFFKQSEWSDVYGSGTVSSCGCAICSVAMAFSFLSANRNGITPTDLLNKIETKYGDRNHFYIWENKSLNKGSGTDTGSLVINMASDYGLEAYEINGSQLLSELQNGHLIVMSCKNPKQYPVGHRLQWTNYAHIVLLSGVNQSNPSLIYCHNCSKANLISEQYSVLEVCSLVNTGFWSVKSKTNVTIPVLNAASKSIWGIGRGGDSTGGAISEVDYADTKTKVEHYSGTANLVLKSYSYEIEYETKTVEYDARVFRDAEATSDLLATSLLTYPTLVESPFIQLEVGDYIFGTYSLENAKLVKYPNYISNMTVKKTNGQVNEYTITLIHLIEPGTDPNIVDKILSSISSNRIVNISYGDYNAPSFTYKKEEALLISSTSTTDFAGSKITYTLQCTSNATQLYARLFSFEREEAVQPSAKIIDMLWGANSSKYGLLDAFPGMKNKTNALKFIAIDDQAVTIEAKTSVDPISYINYLVSCMQSKEDNVNTVLKSATYKMSIFDTTFGGPDNINGAYFSIKKISTSDASNSALSNADIYKIDVGYPTDNMVLEFNVNDDQTWSLLYNYAGDIVEPVYNLTSDGILKEEYLPRLALSKSKNVATADIKTWWTNMTKFPVKATLKLKGLVKPAMLASYIKINAVFYGLRHISSGLYFITAQTDSVSGQGYRTTLELQRISGYNEYLTTEKKTKSEVIPTNVIVTASLKNVSVDYDTSLNNVLISGYEPDLYTSLTTTSVNDKIAIYQKSSYLETGDPAGCNDTVGPNATCLAIGAALSTMMNTNNVVALKWGASAILNRIEDLKKASKLTETAHFYLYIHCNNTVINSYSTSGKKVNPTLYLKYQSYLGQNTVFPAEAAYAYDTVIEACKDGKIPYDTQFLYTDLTGKIRTTLGISKLAVEAIKLVINNGQRFTTANYFGKTWTSLICNGKMLTDSTVINNSLNTFSDIGTNTQQIGADPTYWLLGKTVLTTDNNISGVYVGHPNNIISYPAFIVDAAIADLNVSVVSASDISTITEKKVWDDFIANGFSEAGTAGIMGNILCEGGLVPTTVEYSFCRDLIIGKAFISENSPYKIILNSITAFIDTFVQNTSLDPKADPKLNYRAPWIPSKTVTSGYSRWGYGMVQWTDLDRKITLINAAKKLNSRATNTKISVGSYEAQFLCIIDELNGNYKSVGDQLKVAIDPIAACSIVFKKYEGPGDSSLSNRQEAAVKIYEKYRNLK